MLHQRQSVYFIHKKHIQPNQSVFAAWFQQHSGGRTPSGWFFLLRLKTAAEQQLHENSVSVRSDCVKTEDPEDTNKKLLYFKVSTCVLIIKSWRAFPQVSRNSVCFSPNTTGERASPLGYNISSLVLLCLLWTFGHKSARDPALLMLEI